MSSTPRTARVVTVCSEGTVESVWPPSALFPRPSTGAPTHRPTNPTAATAAADTANSFPKRDKLDKGGYFAQAATFGHVATVPAAGGAGGSAFPPIAAIHTPLTIPEVMPTASGLPPPTVKQEPAFDSASLNSIPPLVPKAAVNPKSNPAANSQQTKAIESGRGKTSKTYAPLPKQPPISALGPNPKQNKTSSTTGALPASTTIEEAAEFVYMMRVRFSDKAFIYYKFVNIMHELEAGRIEFKEMMFRVNLLLEGYDEISAAFNRFLPPEITLGITTRPAEGVYAAEVARLQRLRKRLLGLIAWINDLKICLASDPVRYKHCLNTLKDLADPTVDGNVEAIADALRGRLGSEYQELTDSFITLWSGTHSHDEQNQRTDTKPALSSLAAGKEGPARPVAKRLEAESDIGARDDEVVQPPGKRARMVDE